MRRTRTSVVLVLVGVILVAGNLWAQTRGERGTTSGVIVEAAQDYLLVQPPGDAPRRLYYKEFTNRDPQFKAGDTVEVAWSFEDRREVESVKRMASPLPIPVAAAKPSAAPTTAPTTAPSGGLVDYDNSTGSKVNMLLDNMMALAERLLQLPAFIVVGFAGTAVVIGMLLMRRLRLIERRPLLAAGLRIGLGGVSLVAVIYLIDQKISRLQDELLELRLRLNSGVAVVATQASPSLNVLTKNAPRQTFLFDLTQAERMLETQFGQVELKPMICDEATDFIQISLNNPFVKAGLAVVDLKNPNVKVKIGANFSYKTLTSSFAKENQLSVAINGEAGATPSPNSGLGTWRGHMVQDGNVLLVEDPKIQRPFLSFDQKNGVRFISAGAADRAVPSDGNNVIWGRWDVVTDGQPSPTTMRDRQPRTAMAINREGTRLYLLVVDGRQPRYSQGMTRTEVGQALQSFGAFSGMLCDEGGSSCIYVKQLGGIANVPSDNQGQERPTYTHFGIGLQ